MEYRSIIRAFVPALVVVMVMLYYPEPAAFAGAFEQLQDMAGGSVNVPDVSPPARVDDYEDSGNSSSDSEDDSWYRQEQERTKQHQIHKQRRQQQYRQAPGVRPAAPVAPAPSISPQQVFENQKQSLLMDFRMPAGLAAEVPPSSSALTARDDNDGSGIGITPLGLSDGEWKEFSDCQKSLDAIYAKSKLEPSELTEMKKLEALRIAIWAKAISIPGLTAEERERLKLNLHTLNNPGGLPVATVSPGTYNEWNKPPPPPAAEQTTLPVATINPVASWLVGQYAVGQVQTVMEMGGEKCADEILGEGNSFGDFLATGKIALAYRKGGMSSALAQTASFLVGKIPFPQANLAVEGGRQYANVVFRAENRFMTDALEATGGQFDEQKFWSDFRDDCTTGQKAVMEFIGYGTN